MEKVLEQLYNGELYPYSKYQTTIEQFKKNKDVAFKSYSVFIKKLPGELKDEFDELIDSYIDLLPLELEQNFINGFRIGARIMVEVYTTSEIMKIIHDCIRQYIRICGRNYIGWMNILLLFSNIKEQVSYHIPALFNYNLFSYTFTRTRKVKSFSLYLI